MHQPDSFQYKDPLPELKDDEVAMAGNAPLSLRMAQESALQPVASELPLSADYAPSPIFGFGTIGKFVLFVACSWITTLPLIWFSPFMVFPALGNQQTRTILLMVLIWNLIGATLFTRTKVHKDDLILVLAYMVSTMIIPVAGIFFLPILFARALDTTKRSPAELGNIRTQLLLAGIFAMPAIVWPMWVPAAFTILSSLGNLFMPTP